MPVTIGGRDTMPAGLGARLQRRVSFEVRRDAAEVLSNGRVLYDALFSRTGIQTYGDSVEYRPPDEVFAPASLASGGLCPGVLLHPSSNYGTQFGVGAHPVRGTSGDTIIEHVDHVHTAGKLMVWDQAWNDGIADGSVAELSVGYTIEPDYTPGTAPDGTAYAVVHRDIVWDHIAGVPAGNAETARVVLDAARSAEARGRLATRAALAKIAASRSDARPVYYILGTWPTRRDSAAAESEPETEDTETMDITTEQIKDFARRLDAATTKGPVTPKTVHDAWVDIWGDSTDPDMKRALLALSQATTVEGATATATATTTTSSTPTMTAEQDAEDKGETKMDAAALEAEIKRRVDARVKTELEARADALALARAAIGTDYKHDGKSTTEMRLDVIRKVTPTKGRRLDRLDAADQRAAVAMAFEDAREVLDGQLDYGERLAAAINAERSSVRGDEKDIAPELAELAKRMDAQTKAAATTAFGSPRPPSQT